SLEPRIREIPNLVVVSASAADQRSWVSDDLHQTVFGYHLVEGLKGAADENGDGRIDAWELYHHVSASVERWVRANREAVQTPILLPWDKEGERRARAMHLTMVEQPYQPPEPAQAAPLETSTLQQEWERCQQLAGQLPSPAVYTPQLWQEYRA